MRSDKSFPTWKLRLQVYKIRFCNWVWKTVLGYTPNEALLERIPKIEETKYSFRIVRSQMYFPKGMMLEDMRDLMVIDLAKNLLREVVIHHSLSEDGTQMIGKAELLIAKNLREHPMIISEAFARCDNEDIKKGDWDR